jgi:hypothetical protein
VILHFCGIVFFFEGELICTVFREIYTPWGYRGVGVECLSGNKFGGFLLAFEYIRPSSFRLNIFHIQDDCAPGEGNYL